MLWELLLEWVAKCGCNIVECFEVAIRDTGGLSPDMVQKLALVTHM